MIRDTECPLCGKFVAKDEMRMAADTLRQTGRVYPTQCKFCFFPEQLKIDEQKRLHDEEQLKQRKIRHQQLLQEILLKEQQSNNVD